MTDYITDIIICYEVDLIKIKQYDDEETLQYVQEQTYELCLVAVKQNNGWALQFVKKQSYELCLIAVKKMEVFYNLLKNKAMNSV